MPKRVLKGTVVSLAGDKSVVVQVERRIVHPLYGKVMKRRKKFMAHDEEGRSKRGDRVHILESRPYSKRKRFALVRVEEKLR